MDRARGIDLRILTWNLFHGRDFPPEPAPITWRSRLLRLSERGETHVQVNRDLLPEFSAVLAAAEWDVALLQEAPPRWTDALADACDASSHRVLTSRNLLAPLRAFAARLNPDLIGSNEGGSNLTLVRRSAGEIVERRELELRPAGRPERRALGFVRLRPAAAPAAAVCVGNLHASAGRANRALAEGEATLAAERCLGWAAGAPLILGGDFNLRPAESELFDLLARSAGLGGVTAPDSIDHLLACGVETVDGPRPWPAERREVDEDGLAIRLSDHAPVEATFRVQAV
ncbi:MAG TPA: endonuclease/exonuclease/phosphatase family protein [Solirubrobacterales bacterium]|nr:endonuclease/exonuclease/phosphatase family protein [Solirubrobacterales bacterium]